MLVQQLFTGYQSLEHIIWKIFISSDMYWWHYDVCFSISACWRPCGRVFWGREAADIQTGWWQGFGSPTTSQRSWGWTGEGNDPFLSSCVQSCNDATCERSDSGASVGSSEIRHGTFVSVTCSDFRKYVWYQICVSKWVEPFHQSTWFDCCPDMHCTELWTYTIKVLEHLSLFSFLFEIQAVQ